jgi:S-disulfanyl-L-cysteine oxidoreductase SoxD
MHSDPPTNLEPLTDNMKPSDLLMLLPGALTIVGILAWELTQGGIAIDAHDAVAVAKGKAVYAAHCASCHGANLEGQPDWQEPLADGSYPAPPQDASGHTWQHSDTELYVMVRDGEDPDKSNPMSSMPAFGKTLSEDDIFAVLAFIKASWPPDVQGVQERLNRKGGHMAGMNMDMNRQR